MGNATVCDRLIAAERDLTGRQCEEIADAWPADDERPELEETVEPDDESELEFEELPCTDDSRWDAFIPDDDECDPLPEEGDFWMGDG